MERRVLLGTLVTGLAWIAGCSSPDTDAGAGRDRREPYDVPPTVTARAPLDPPANARRTVENDLGQRRVVVGVDPATPVPMGAQFQIGLLDPATERSPARVWIALTNVGDQPRTFTFGGSPPFGRYEGHRWTAGDEVGGVGALLVPEKRTRQLLPDAPSRGCWRARTALPDGTTSVERTVIPGESIEGTYLLVRPDQPETACPFPRRAVYQFGDLRIPLSFTVGVWHPSTSIPDESRFSGSVPGLPGYDRTVWFHDAATAPVYLRPLSERVAVGEVCRLALENFSKTTFRIDPGGWELYRREGQRWRRVAGGQTGAISQPVPPGGRHVLGVRLGGQETTAGKRAPVGDVPNLAPGTYAIRHGSTSAPPSAEGPIRIGAGVERETSGPETAYAALVELRRS